MAAAVAVTDGTSEHDAGLRKIDCRDMEADEGAQPSGE